MSTRSTNHLINFKSWNHSVTTELNTYRDAHPLNDLGHELGALILQPGETEKLGRLPHVQDVFLTYGVGERLPAEALQPRQQVHVSHAQHVEHVLHHQLHRIKKSAQEPPEYKSARNPTSLLIQSYCSSNMFLFWEKKKPISLEMFFFFVCVGVYILKYQIQINSIQYLVCLWKI